MPATSPEAGFNKGWELGLIKAGSWRVSGSVLQGVRSCLGFNATMSIDVPWECDPQPLVNHLKMLLRATLALFSCDLAPGLLSDPRLLQFQPLGFNTPFPAVPPGFSSPVAVNSVLQQLGQVCAAKLMFQGLFLLLLCLFSAPDPDLKWEKQGQEE